MSILTTFRHNQGFFTSAFIALIIFIACLSCQMTDTQKQQTIAAAADTAIAAAVGSPIPWPKVALILGNIIGTGALIDNRRKDILITLLKKTSHATSTLSDSLRHQSDIDSTRPDPLRNHRS